MKRIASLESGGANAFNDASSSQPCLELSGLDAFLPDLRIQFSRLATPEYRGQEHEHGGVDLGSLAQLLDSLLDDGPVIESQVWEFGEAVPLGDPCVVAGHGQCVGRCEGQECDAGDPPAGISAGSRKRSHFEERYTLYAGFLAEFPSCPIDWVFSGLYESTRKCPLALERV
jgi:hypothetical protein